MTEHVAVSEVWQQYRERMWVELEPLRETGSWPWIAADGRQVRLISPERIRYDGEDGQIVGYSFSLVDSSGFHDRAFVRPDATIELQVK